MSSANKRTPTKFTRKNPYPNTTKFTNDELLNIIADFHKRQSDSKTPVASWMGFDIKNENQNEKMKDKGVRYMGIIVTDLSGKVRPLVRTTAPCVTKSKCKPAKTDDGRIPSKFSFSTRILINQVVGDRHDDRVIDDAWITAKIDELADDTVNNKFPDATDDLFADLATKQAALIKAEYNQWLVEKAIASEFERLLKEKDTRATIKWAYKPKDHKIQSNVQFARTPTEDNPDDMALANEDGVIPIDEPMVYHSLRLDTNDGSLWCRIYDMTQPVKGGKRKLAAMKDPDTGKINFLNVRTLEAWLRPGSVFAGIEKYQLCIHGKGASMHATLSELLVKRAARSESSSQVDAETATLMDDFGGQFDAGDDDDDDDDDVPIAPKPSRLTGIEAQMAALESGSVDDE